MGKGKGLKRADLVGPNTDVHENNQAWQLMETETGQRKRAVEEHSLGKWDSSAD